MKILTIPLLLTFLLAPNSAFAQFGNFSDSSAEQSVIFSVQPGSLRTNIRRLAEQVNWRLVAWDETVRKGGAVIDWQVWSDYQIQATSLDDALLQLIEPYGLHARLHEPDRAVAIYLLEKIRFQSNN